MLKSCRICHPYCSAGATRARRRSRLRRGRQSTGLVSLTLRGPRWPRLCGVLDALDEALTLRLGEFVCVIREGAGEAQEAPTAETAVANSPRQHSDATIVPIKKFVLVAAVDVAADDGYATGLIAICRYLLHPKGKKRATSQGTDDADRVLAKDR